MSYQWWVDPHLTANHFHPPPFPTSFPILQDDSYTRSNFTACFNTEGTFDFEQTSLLKTNILNVNCKYDISLFHQVPLGLIAKNENLNEDMVDILDHLQHVYVKMAEKKLASGRTEKVPVETSFFGGHQLTEERARNVQLARSYGSTTEKRLEGVWPKNEDWHAIRTAYKVNQYIYS